MYYIPICQVAGLKMGLGFNACFSSLIFELRHMEGLKLIGQLMKTGMMDIIILLCLCCFIVYTHTKKRSNINIKVNKLTTNDSLYFYLRSQHNPVT